MLEGLFNMTLGYSRRSNTKVEKIKAYRVIDKKGTDLWLSSMTKAHTVTEKSK